MIPKIKYDPDTKSFSGERDTLLMIAYFDSNKSKSKGELTYRAAWINLDYLALAVYSMTMDIKSKYKTSQIISAGHQSQSTDPSDDDLNKLLDKILKL